MTGINKGKQLIILTVPHYICNGDDHWCDISAPKLAKQISEKISSSEKDVIVYYGTESRKEIDLNRVQAINTIFRMKIFNLIKDKIKITPEKSVNHENIIYLIDCHSFPGKSFQNIRIDDPDVSILMANCQQLTVVEELTDIFRENGVEATKHIGQGNSIIEQFYYPGKISNSILVPILLEVNENKENKLDQIGYCVNIWINKINKFYDKN